MGDDEVQRGAAEHFRATRSLSAVSVQLRRFSAPGFGFLPADVYTASFESRAIANPNARHPLAAQTRK